MKALGYSGHLFLQILGVEMAQEHLLHSGATRNLKPNQVLSPGLQIHRDGIPRWTKPWNSSGQSPGRAGTGGQVPGTTSHLCPHQRLEAGFEIIDAAAVEFGHLLQELLVLGFKILLDGAQLLTGLGTDRGSEPRDRDRALGQDRGHPRTTGCCAWVWGQTVSSLEDPWDHSMEPGGIQVTIQWNQ